MIGIYKITSPNNRIYIGQTTNFKKRLISYKNINQNKSQVRLKESFNKYGIDNHIFEFIEKCSIESLNTRERYWQDYYDVLSKKGLNCKLTETKDKSGKHSEETKAKISASNTGKKLSEEHKVKISEFMKTRPVSDETRRKNSESQKGKIIPEHQKQLLSELRKEEYIQGKLNIGKKGKESPFAKKIVDITTGEYWDTLTECCLVNGLSIKNMSRKLNGARPNNTNYIYF